MRFTFTKNRAIASLCGVLVLLGTATIPAQPAAAAESFQRFKICNGPDGYTPIVVADVVDGGYWHLIQPNGNCTAWLHPGGIRVDTDPYGPSHSYKIKPIGPGASGVYGPCHTNSDNHYSDPPNPPQNTEWTVYYKNYNHGNCTD